MGSSTHMSTTNCTSTPCTQYGHAGVRSADTQSEDPKCAHSNGTHGERRGCMHAHGACLPCRVPSVCTLGAAAIPPPTGAARWCIGKRTRHHPAHLRHPRGAIAAHAPPPPTAPAPVHRTAPPHHPRWTHTGCRRNPAAPPNAHAADRQARHHGAGLPTHARARSPASAAATHPRRPHDPPHVNQTIRLT